MFTAVNEGVSRRSAGTAFLNAVDEPADERSRKDLDEEQRDLEEHTVDRYGLPLVHLPDGELRDLGGIRAYWVRAVADRDCKAFVQFWYE